MNKCKKTKTGKHIVMPETIYNEELNWFVKLERCIACGLVDDETTKVQIGEIKSRKPWQ